MEKESQESHKPQGMHDENKTDKIDKIEALKTNLYSQGYKPPAAHHEPLTPDKDQVGVLWNHTSNQGQPKQTPESKIQSPNSFFKRIFIIAIIFFVLSVGLVVSIFFFGLNVVSASKVDITFEGPVSVAAGEELDFDTVVHNNNGSALINPVLYIDYPDGTKHVQNLTQDLNHEKIIINQVAAHGSERKTVQSVLFGAQNTVEHINVALEYSMKGSNNVYRKTGVYDVTISSSPVSVDINYPQETITSQDVEVAVTITSNSSVPLTHLLLQVQYPFGFTFKESVPQASFDTNNWQIPTLKTGDKKTFIIRGHLEGKEGDDRVFKFNLGAASLLNEKIVATSYLNLIKSVAIRKAPLDVQVTLNGVSDSGIVARQGSNIMGHILIKNNLPVQLISTQVKAVFGGQLLDPLSPNGSGGFYRSIDKSILWDKASLPALTFLDPGQQTDIQFNFSTLSVEQLRAFNNGTITLDITATGQKIGNNGISETVSNSLSRLVKIQSVLAASQRATYSTGPFKNSGPIPPIANIPTTYTIMWDVSNSSNLVAGAVARATLPQYVTWLGVTSPKTENITFDALQNQIIWTIGDIPAGTTKNQLAREVSFQVKLLPSTSQLGSSPDLVNNLTIQGVDNFTNNTVQATAPAATTRLNSEVIYGSQDGIVRQ